MHIKKSSITSLDPTTDINDISGGRRWRPYGKLSSNTIFDDRDLDYLGRLRYRSGYRSDRGTPNNRLS
jgi:hypothetical protein